MELSDLYPAFTLVDKWGRKLRYSRTQDGYFRRVLNPPARMAQDLEAKKINRRVYAMALLYHTEYIAGHAVGVFVDNGLVGPDTNPDDEFDKFFPPKGKP